MSFSNQTSLQGTLQELKEIVTALQGEDHEATRLVRQMEALVARIETRSKRGGNELGKDTGLAIKPVVSAAQALT